MGFASLAGLASAEVKIDALKAPNQEWTKNIKEAGAEVEFYRTANQGEANLTVRKFPNISQSSKTFLDVTYDEMKKNAEYQGARLGSIHSESRGGKKWDAFELSLPGKMKQVLLARKADSNTVVIVMYTALDESFDRYQDAFEDIVKQASK